MLVLALAIVLCVFIIFIAIFLLRRLLWMFSGLFFIVDEFMWFLYNPLRLAQREEDNTSKLSGARRGAFLVLTGTLVAPIYKFTIYVLTAPLRVLTALYFDVVMYLVVMTSDTIEELFNPKLGNMRNKKGLNYLGAWILGIPKRLIWFVFKNILALVDSFFMFCIGVAWPTFTVYHGTTHAAATNITRGGGWLVGKGNFGGSGIYFGRSPKVAKHYSRQSQSSAGESFSQNGYKVIVARVTFSLVKNISSLGRKEREMVGKWRGDELAKKVGFPYATTELWRHDFKWWEYCILQGGKDGQFIHTWRIRPVGYLTLKDGLNTGTLTRLWGGKEHYAMKFGSIAMFFLSLPILMYLGVYWSIIGQSGLQAIFNPVNLFTALQMLLFALT